MTIYDDVSTLRRIPLFAGLDQRGLMRLATNCSRVKFSAGQFLCREGDDADAAYVVIAGEAIVTVAAGGEERVLTRSGPSALIGELGIICNVPRSATVRADGELEALRIEREHFLLLLREQPDAALQVLRAIGLRLVELTQQIARGEKAGK